MEVIPKQHSESPSDLQEAGLLGNIIPALVVKVSGPSGLGSDLSLENLIWLLPEGSALSTLSFGKSGNEPISKIMIGEPFPGQEAVSSVISLISSEHLCSDFQLGVMENVQI